MGGGERQGGIPVQREIHAASRGVGEYVEENNERREACGRGGKSDTAGSLSFGKKIEL